jgi:hypothetical protein
VTDADSCEFIRDVPRARAQGGHRGGMLVRQHIPSACSCPGHILQASCPPHARGQPRLPCRPGGSCRSRVTQAVRLSRSSSVRRSSSPFSAP